MLTRQSLTALLLLSLAFQGCHKVDTSFDLALCEKFGTDQILIDTSKKVGGFADASGFDIQTCSLDGQTCILSPLLIAIPNSLGDTQSTYGRYNFEFQNQDQSSFRSIAKDRVTGDTTIAKFDEHGVLVDYSFETNLGNASFEVCRGRIDFETIKLLAN